VGRGVRRFPSCGSVITMEAGAGANAEDQDSGAENANRASDGFDLVFLKDETSNLTQKLREQSQSVRKLLDGSDLEDLEDEESSLMQDRREMSESVQKILSAIMVTTERVQRLKNMLTDRLIRDVLTSAELALRLEVSGESSAKIDYPKILKRIDNSIDTLQARCNGQTGDEDTLTARLRAASEELSKCMMECDLDSAESILRGMAASTAVDNFVVREDGTVDYDEFLASSREVGGFGVELWERLEAGQKLPGISALFGQASATSEEATAEVQRLDAAKRKAEATLGKMLQRRVQTTKELQLIKENSGANSNKLMAMLKTFVAKTEELHRLVALCEFNLEIQRMCVYLEKDIQQSVGDTSELKKLIAKVDFIERERMKVMGGLDAEGLERTTEDENLTTASSFLAFVDDEKLGLIRSTIEELKAYLGLEGSKVKQRRRNRGKPWRSFMRRARAGLRFYGAGFQMLWSDVLYAIKLFRKVLGGEQLVPREVYSLRRTGRDLATMVPFTLILLAPITPAGTVLVVNFVQRKFPYFFPSCFTDKRQNLRRLCSDVLTMEEEAQLRAPAKRQSRWRRLFKR